MRQFHWELDCVGFSPFEIWRCGCVEMMRGVGGEGFLFPILRYRRGIARVSPEVRELSCLVLVLLLLLLLLTFPLPSCARHMGLRLYLWLVASL